MGILDTLANMDLAGRRNLTEAVQGLHETSKRAKLRENIEKYITTYGMDLSPHNVKSFMSETGAGIDELQPLFGAVKQYRDAQSAGRYKMSPGEQLFGPQNEKIAEVPPTLPKDTIKRAYDRKEKKFSFFPESVIAADPERYGETLEDVKDIKKAGQTVINIGEEAKKTAAVTEARDTAEYKTYLRSSPKVKDDAMKTASEGFDKFDWQDMALPKKEQAAFRVMDNWYKSTFPNARFGEVNGVKGWYSPGLDGKPTLIKKW